MDVPLWVWAVTVAAVLGMLALDLVGHVRTPHAPGLRESALWSAGYVGVAVVFGLCRAGRRWRRAGGRATSPPT